MMIHVIIEITEKEAQEDEFAMGMEAFIKGDGTSTDKEFRMAKAWMKRLEAMMVQGKAVVEKAGLEVTNFSLGGKSLKPTDKESE